MKRFTEPDTTAVYTSKFVVEESSPILVVYHDEDGSWQFHGIEDLASEADMRVVGLKEIIELDKSVLEIADMPKGFEASRNTVEMAWEVTESEL